MAKNSGNEEELGETLEITEFAVPNPSTGTVKKTNLGKILVLLFDSSSKLKPQCKFEYQKVSKHRLSRKTPSTETVLCMVVVSKYYRNTLTRDR